MKSVFQLRFLGPVQIERDGESVHGFESRKALALLAYLAVEGQPVPRERLVDLFWEDKTEAQGRNNLNWVLHRLSTHLPGCLQADRHTVQFRGEADKGTYWLDLDTFEELETQGDPASLTGAVELYRGEFLEGLYLKGCPEFELWHVREQERWRRRAAGALNQLVAHYGQRGDVEQGLRFARRLLRLDPWREEAHREVMRLLALDGQRSAALAQYETCRRTLAEELGVEPSEATELLYTQIQAGELAPPAPVPRVEVPVQRPAFLEEAAEREDAEGPVFVARERELARLDGYLEAALAGQGQVAFVIGGPGRGKTVLMCEFARQAMKVHPDLLVAHGNCNAYSGVGDPYLPFREVLGMLTGDVEGRWAAGTISRDHALRLWAALPLALQALVDHGPSLIGTVVSGAPLLSRAAAVVPESTEGDAAWLPELRVLAERERLGHGGLEQSAIFQQVTNVLRALAQAHPLLLVLDDVQWADAGSIGLLFHLGRRLEGCRILITGAYRPEEVALERGGERHPLDKVLAEFRRSFGDVWVDLRRVDETQGRSFVDGFLDTEPNRLGEGFRNELFLRTRGHPLFTVELLRAMQERDDLIQDAEGRWVQGPALDWERLPARVEAVIEARVERLDEGLREVLAVASVEGERFTAQVVARVQDIPEREILRVLSRELGGRHRLVREGGEAQVGGRFLSHYQFAHALFQEYVYRRLSGGERRLLHGEVAMALEALYGGQTDEIAAPLAHHYVEAGQTEKAIECSLRAGEQARLAYANEEAIAYLHRVLELLDESPLGESRKDWRVEALGGLGQIYLGIGKIAEAEGPLQEAIALGREIGLSPRELVRLYHWLGEVLRWQGRFDDQIRVGVEGLTLLGDDTESIEAALMNQVIARGHFLTGNLAGFRELTHRTAQFIQHLPYSEELGSAYSSIVGACFEVDKNVEEGMKWFQALEEMAIQHHDLRAWLGAHLEAADFLAEVGDLHGTVSRCQQGLELSARIGDCLGEGWSLIRMAQAFLSLGNLEKAEECADRALEALKAVGSGGGIARAYRHIGQIALCRGDWEGAVEAFRKAVQILELSNHPNLSRATYLLGQAHLAQQDREESLRRFQESVALETEESGWLKRDPYALFNRLSGLETVYDDSTSFRAFCCRLREERPALSDLPLTQWFLEPANVGAIREPLLQHDEFTGSLLPDWVWQDPFDDCSFTVQNGLEIHAANGRDLMDVNLSAPRLLRPVSGDFMTQTVCVPISKEKPAIGGLLLWKSKQNHLRLDRGTRGEREILFGGCLGNQGVVIGRGQLSLDPSSRAFLRLERVGGRVNALCSADGENWFTVGHVAFPVQDPVQIGLHAIGSIDRGVYHGAYPDGAAIRFESFHLWRR